MDREKITQRLVEAKASSPAAPYFNRKLFHDAMKVLYFWVKDETKRTPEGKIQPFTYASFRAYAQILNMPTVARHTGERVRELRSAGLLTKIEAKPVAVFLPRSDLIENPDQLVTTG